MSFANTVCMNIHRAFSTPFLFLFLIFPVASMAQTVEDLESCLNSLIVGLRETNYQVIHNTGSIVVTGDEGERVLHSASGTTMNLSTRVNTCQDGKSSHQIIADLMRRYSEHSKTLDLDRNILTVHGVFNSCQNFNTSEHGYPFEDLRQRLSDYIESRPVPVIPGVSPGGGGGVDFGNGDES